MTRRIDVEVLHPHDFTYTAGEGEDANKITAVCNGEGDCEIAEGLTMIITVSNAVYDGEAHTATLNNYNTTAFPGPYTIEYYSGKTKLNGAPVNVGEYTAMITVGEATASVDFAITIADTMTSAPTANDLTYNGKAQDLVTAGSVNAGKMLYALSDSKDKAPDDKAFSESIPTATDAGTYYVWYKASGDKNHNGTGAEVVEAKIKGMRIKGAKVVVRNKTYTGKALKPGSKIVVNGKRLKKGVDYTISFKNNKNVGVGKAVINGIGNYTGKVTTKFNIRPKKAAIKSVSSPKAKQLKVTWKKTPQATGYQIKVSTSKKFTEKSTVKNVFAKKNSFVNKTFTNLKSGKTYYVKVRAFKKVGGTNIYGQYSAVKTVTVK